jgi:hypothetical protein
VFIVAEEFNNSPTDSAAFGLGKRVVPPYSYGVSHKTAVKAVARKGGLTREEKRALVTSLKIPV